MMKARPRAMALSGLALAILAIAWAAVPGTFRGTVVEPMTHTASDEGWVYVEGRNQMVRRVEVHKATILYADEVPRAQRTSSPQAWLIAGTEVRVTAQQGSDGEWHATRVEILKLPKADDPPDGMWQSAVRLLATTGLTNS